MNESVPGRIFISYRRQETAWPAGRLYDVLVEHFPAEQVFKDIDNIELGDDFVQVITGAVDSCDVLLALIGDQWLTITDAHGRRRLDDPHDFVRLEIEAALARNVRVIPVLVDGAAMPSIEELPDSLDRLAHRQALELSPARFDFDTGRLLKVLDRSLAEIRAAQVKPATMPDVPQAAAVGPPPAPPEPPRRSSRLWLLVGAGIAIVLVPLIIAILANRGATPLTNGSAAPSTAANGPVLFHDDFSSRAAGWNGDGAVAKGAGYAGGAYRISAPPTSDGSGAGSAPKKASRVWPSAPPRIRIAVEGHRLPESDQSMSYGILCRINGEAAYVLTISDDYASIEKWGKYKQLKEAQPKVDPYTTSELVAVCTGGNSGPVHLELWVNGEKVIETTDTNAPLRTGGVGLAVTTYKTTQASVAEFDNFVVEQVA